MKLRRYLVEPLPGGRCRLSAEMTTRRGELVTVGGRVFATRADLDAWCEGTG